MKPKEAPRDHFGLSSWYYNKSLISMADNCLTEDTQKDRIWPKLQALQNCTGTSKQNYSTYSTLKLVS